MKSVSIREVKNSLNELDKRIKMNQRLKNELKVVITNGDDESLTPKQKSKAEVFQVKRFLNELDKTIKNESKIKK